MTITGTGVDDVDQPRPSPYASPSRPAEWAHQVTGTPNGHTSERITMGTAGPEDFLRGHDAPAVGAGGAATALDEMPNGPSLLIVKRGPYAGSWFLLDKAVISAGRHPDTDIFLDDATVSRDHAEFRFDNGEFSVVDVGSLNGIYLNRSPVSSAVLANGDELQIGKFRLLYVANRAARTAAAGAS